MGEAKVSDRYLLSGRWWGGAGGSERAIASMAEALSSHADVDVVVDIRLKGPWDRRPKGVQVFVAERSWRWRTVPDIAVPFRRKMNPRYVAHLALAAGPNVLGASRALSRLMNPCGATVSLPPGYDLLALESPDNVRLVERGRWALLPPPVLDLADETVRVSRIPSEFFLTVFNPHGPAKGEDELVRLVDHLPIPLVWCHSTSTDDFRVDPRLKAHPRVIHVVNATREEMRWLYEGCASYLSFSRSEGFGWAIADALNYSPCVVSRPVGILSMQEAQARVGVHLVPPGPWRVSWNEVLAPADGRIPPGPMDWLGAEQFRTRLTQLLPSRNAA